MIRMVTSDHILVIPLGMCLRAMREALGKNRTELAQVLGFAHSNSVANIEHEKTSIAPKKLSATLAWFYEESGKQGRIFAVTYAVVSPGELSRRVAMSNRSFRLLAMSLTNDASENSFSLTVRVK